MQGRRKSGGYEYMQFCEMDSLVKRIIQAKPRIDTRDPTVNNIHSTVYKKANLPPNYNSRHKQASIAGENLRIFSRIQEIGNHNKANKTSNDVHIEPKIQYQNGLRLLPQIQARNRQFSSRLGAVRSVVADTINFEQTAKRQEKYGSFASKYSLRPPQEDPLVTKEKNKIIPFGMRNEDIRSIQHNVSGLASQRQNSYQSLHSRKSSAQQIDSPRKIGQNSLIQISNKAGGGGRIQTDSSVLYGQQLQNEDSKSQTTLPPLAKTNSQSQLAKPYDFVHRKHHQSPSPTNRHASVQPNSLPTSTLNLQSGAQRRNNSIIKNGTIGQTLLTAGNASVVSNNAQGQNPMDLSSILKQLD